ncbi:hypothetical protein VOLCADRAFT_106917 [Volvox carteri f. nagariensis]|uniref:ApaG domain-containing protein n=1 Tax=Volvox carteri f. nagariensis TaxID=3068 RepID=D8UAK4_VOLCA|nr:uncharacterized protein VOLCADRAFT_106917 [Volvox carteri f. nagariensis]EFJ43339.1 hypothetical protein VOLCADRAFT_106917 [Volvox carteri f. nagariensis]|eukprot:XP_002955699.1 hypothetical protein VOLCADRAFT_106917 [Volvox carteri f. nagariensis]
MARGCSCSKEAFRIIIWMCWVANMIVTTIYYLLSAVTFYKLLNASQQSILNPKLLEIDRIWRAPLAACLLGSLLVFGFNMFSCCILLKKSINRSGPGFGYGFMVAFCFTLAFFCLLVGLTMDGFKQTIRGALENDVTAWGKYSTDLYIGAEVFAFICFAMFILFFLILVIFQGAVSDHLGINTEMNNPYVPMADPATLGLTAGGAVMSSDEKAVSSTDPQYNTQYNPNDYMNNDQYNQYYSTHYNQGAGAYQSTTEFNTNEYTYDQEQGYQAPYDTNGYSTVPTGGHAAGSAATPAYAAPQPPAYNDHASESAAAFYSQQGAYGATASYATPIKKPVPDNWGHYGYSEAGLAYQASAMSQLLGSSLRFFPGAEKLDASALRHVLRENFKANKGASSADTPRLVGEAMAALRVLLEQLYLHRCSSTCTTEGVRVEATSKFSTAANTYGRSQNLFSYRVRVTNLRDEPIQVLGREWTILNDKGAVVVHVPHVPGNAVVGQQPIIPPNDCFEYISGTDLDTPSGLQRGMLEQERRHTPAEAMDWGPDRLCWPACEHSRPLAGGTMGEAAKGCVEGGNDVLQGNQE